MMLEIRYLEGEARAEFGAKFFEKQPERYKKYLLWDFDGPESDKGILFLKILERARIVGSAALDGEPFAIAWAGSIGWKSRAAALHFAFTKYNREYSFICGSDFVNRCHKEYVSLLALMPEEFKHSIQFAKRLGFKVIENISLACYLAAWNTTVNGALLIKQPEYY